MLPAVYNRPALAFMMRSAGGLPADGFANSPHLRLDSIMRKLKWPLLGLALGLIVACGSPRLIPAQPPEGSPPPVSLPVGSRWDERKFGDEENVVTAMPFRTLLLHSSAKR